MSREFHEQHYLKPLFEPNSIALIGASETEGSIGSILARNMLDMSYSGRLFFVNPKHKTLYGLPCYAHIEDVPQRIDLAVLCTPARTIPDLIDGCGQAGTRSAMIISSGFSESGPHGALLERRMLEHARRHRLRILGPNCLGYTRPSANINLTYTHSRIHAGHIGLISQSGALCAAILDWAQAHHVGFSSVIALGTSSDVDFGEALDYLVNDPSTRTIFLYIEGIRQARRFMSALRAASRCKPVLLIKTGRYSSGEQAAMLHTQVAVGDDDIFDAAVRRVGVVRLHTVGQMYATAQALSAHFHPRGNRVAIMTNGGGPGVMAADHAESIGLNLANLESHTISRLDEILPRGWSRRNPLDIGGDATPTHYAATLQILQSDRHVDGILALLAPHAKSDATQAARMMIESARKSDKPLVTCWMGETQVAEARQLFKGAGIPSFRTPESAVDLFSHLSHYFHNQTLLQQVPAARTGNADTLNPAQLPLPRLENAKLLIETVLSENRRRLSEMESKALLAAFHIPIASTMRARSLSEALVLAEEAGLPVAMKVDSPAIIEKSLYGGVRLNLTTLAAVKDAYLSIQADVLRHQPEASLSGMAIEPMVIKPNGRELRIQIVQDAVFGPVITLSAGGRRFVETRSRQGRPHELSGVALPPLNGTLIQDMLATSHLEHHLAAYPPLPAVRREALEEILLHVSEMACELPWIHTLDINPLIIDEQGAIVADAHIVIQALPLNVAAYAHMAIHPYPSTLISTFQTRSGRQVLVRPIQPEDAPKEQAFIQKLSPESRHFRFMNALRELTPGQLARLTQIDYDREMAFIATTHEKESSQEIQIGVARYAINPDNVSCEFAIVVADDWQGDGLARRLMEILIETAQKQPELHTMHGDFLVDNQRMIHLATRLGFVISTHPDDAGLKRGTLALT